MNIGTLLTSSAASHPANVATVYGPRRMNYEQFNARVNRLANALRRLGLQPRDHVAILMVNCPQMLEVTSQMWCLSPHRLVQSWWRARRSDPPWTPILPSKSPPPCSWPLSGFGNHLHESLVGSNRIKIAAWPGSFEVPKAEIEGLLQDFEAAVGVLNDQLAFRGIERP